LGEDCSSEELKALRCGVDDDDGDDDEKSSFCVELSKE
jgi:hypothetical protein